MLRIASSRRITCRSSAYRRSLRGKAPSALGCGTPPPIRTRSPSEHVMVQGCCMNRSRSRSSMLNDTTPAPPARMIPIAASTGSWPRAWATEARSPPPPPPPGKILPQARANARAFLGGGQPTPQGGVTADLRPTRHQRRGQRRARRIVGILVGEDLESFVTGSLDALNDRQRVSPHMGAEHLDVRDD